jgi:hypothetical protein
VQTLSTAHQGPAELDPAVRERAAQLLHAYVQESGAAPDAPTTAWGYVNLHRSTPTRHAAGRAVLAAEPALQVAFIRVALDWSLTEIARLRRWNLLAEVWRMGDLLTMLYRRRLPYSPSDLRWCALRLAADGLTWHDVEAGKLNLRGLLRGLTPVAEAEGLTQNTRAAFTRLRAHLADAGRQAQGRETLALLDTLLGAELEDAVVDAQDDWGRAAADRFAQLAPQEQAGWGAVLRYALTASGSKPNRKWLSEAKPLLAGVGQQRFAELAAEWLRLLQAPTRGELYRRPDGFQYPTAYIADRNADILKGLAWLCTLVLDDSGALAQALGDAGVACFKKLANIGARSTKAGNACVYALGAMPGLASVAQLQRLAERVKLPSAQKQIGAALDVAAARAGLTRDDLDELATPTFGLADGCVCWTLGDYTVELRVEPSGAAQLRYVRSDGRSQSGVPAALKREHAAELKQAQLTLADLRAALPAQRARLERLLLHERGWPLADWRARYLDHPLLALFTRRLIWTFREGERRAEGCWHGGQLLDVAGQPLDWLTDATRVRLWHPLDASPDDVLAWRLRLEEAGVTQPFKQAHREVYLLTDAERATATYSNRFAAHILRQHQFQALCQQRGWLYRLQGAWDSHNTPTLELPRWGWCAEFDVDGGAGDGAPLSGHAIYLTVGSGQLRFTRLERPGRFALRPTVPLSEIPPRVFSETLRDIDLFVSVCSVGNDPTWFDAGPAEQRDYWWNFAYGELSASAEARRGTLERLLPRLRQLDGRWQLHERFLHVQGDLGTYRIHLGSGNVQLEPNAQHLCIVPGPSSDLAGGGLRLPFEGDTGLALILSKALLLANDRAIKDPTIVRQLAGHRS